MSSLHISATDSTRLDSYLVDNLDVSRSKIEKHIKNNKILVNDKQVKKSYILKIGDDIYIEPFEEEIMEANPEKIDLDIVYEDDDIIIVNKPKGMVVHPAVGNYSGTLVNGLLYHSNNLSSINGEFRPGIVHRIDKDTSGLLMIAKNDKAHAFLARQLEEKTTKRKYIALVWGIIKSDTASIDAPIGRDKLDRKKMCITEDGKKAVTHLKVLERYENATLIELSLETGRTHQIRVHMNYINHPVINDPVYGMRKLIDETGQCLHAKTIGFIHPTTLKYMEFDSELPSEFINILDKFKNS